MPAFGCENIPNPGTLCCVWRAVYALSNVSCSPIITLTSPLCGHTPLSALAHHYAAVEALALDRDQMRDVTDYLLPDTDAFAKHAAEQREFMNAVLPHFDINADVPVKKTAAAGARKRKGVCGVGVGSNVRCASVL